MTILPRFSLETNEAAERQPIQRPHRIRVARAIRTANALPFSVHFYETHDAWRKADAEFFRFNAKRSRDDKVPEFVQKNEDAQNEQEDKDGYHGAILTVLSLCVKNIYGSVCELTP